MKRKLKLAFLYVCRSLGLFELARRLTRGRLNILCYHGFELRDEASFRPKLFMRGADFERRMELIRRAGHRVLPLDEAIECLYAGTLPKNSVAITIDDGFYSTARVAIPILEKYKFPATLYATTYYMQHPHPIFRLVVQYMFWKTRLTNAAFSGYLGLEGAFDLTNASGNDALVWRIIEHGERNCSEDERRSICVRLGQLLDVSYDEIAQSRILDLLTPSELRAATMSGVNIELHTHRHRFPKDDESGALREIADNRRALQAWLPGAFTHFCYPSGLHDERQWPWLQASGIVTATTCLPGSNSRRTPRYKLRRLLDAHAVHPLEFEASLSGFSDLLTGRIMTA